MAIRDTPAPAGQATPDPDRRKHGRRLTPEMDDLVSRLAFQGATPATILRALEKGYAEGRFPFVPTRETVSRLVSKKVRLYQMLAPRPGGDARAAWSLAGPGAGPGPGPGPNTRADGSPSGGVVAWDRDWLQARQDRAVLAAVPAAVERGTWPDGETARWWGYLAARAPALPAADIPDLAALWRARLAEGRPVRDLVLFLACRPWRGEGAFDDYVRAAARAGERLYPHWQGFLPTVARWLQAVVHDLAQITDVLARRGPVRGRLSRPQAAASSAVGTRPANGEAWHDAARARWAAARASLVPLLPVVWYGLVSAAPISGAAGKDRGAAAIARGLDPTGSWPWEPPLPLAARSPVGEAWRWRAPAVDTGTVLGPHEPVRQLLLQVCFALAEAVVALDRWAVAGFCRPAAGLAPRADEGQGRDTSDTSAETRRRSASVRSGPGSTPSVGAHPSPSPPPPTFWRPGGLGNGQAAASGAAADAVIVDLHAVWTAAAAIVRCVPPVDLDDERRSRLAMDLLDPDRQALRVLAAIVAYALGTGSGAVGTPTSELPGSTREGEKAPPTRRGRPPRQGVGGSAR
jgi:hypothetical protein